MDQGELSRPATRPCVPRQENRAIPISRAMVIELAVFTLVPVVPLLLTMVSLEELLKKLVQIVL